MIVESKSFVPATSRDNQPIAAPELNIPVRGRATGLANWIQVGLVFTLIMAAVWTPQGRFNAVVSLLAACLILWFTVRSGYSPQQLGLWRPGAGVAVVVGAGMFIVVAIVGVGSMVATLGPAHPVPWNRAWQYAFWALQQQFILQSFFYLRLESLLGSRRAVLGAAFLFSTAHIPSPVLTLLSFLGGLFFCEMFRRYRNLHPLGLVHAAIGLTIAATLPDSLLHHMRVGIGYLAYRT